MTAHVGSAQLVNTSVAGDVYGPHVASLQTGGYVVVWTHDAPFGSRIAAQLYDNAGQAIGSQFVIPTPSGNFSGFEVEDVVGLPNGDFVVSFSGQIPGGEFNHVPYVARFHSDGTPASNNIALADGMSLFGEDTAVAWGRANNGYMAVFRDYTSEGNQQHNSGGVLFRIFDAADQLIGTSSISNNISGRAPDVGTLQNNNFVVTWTEGFFSAPHTYFLIIGPTGAQLNTAIEVGAVEGSKVVGLSNGDFAVVWAAPGGTTDTDGSGIHGRVYSATGVALTSDFTINTTIAGDQFQPSVTALSDGTFYVTWAGAWKSGTSIFGQTVDSAGNHVGNEVVVNAITSATDQQPDAATLSSGQVVDVFKDNSHAVANPNTGQTDPDTGVVSQLLDPTVQDPPVPKFALPANWTGAEPVPDQGSWSVGDFNGDGKADIFRLGPGGVDMFLSNGTAFDHAGIWTPAGDGSDDRWHIGDFNGDGRTDIFRYLDGTGVDVFLSNGSGFVHDKTWTPAGIGSDNQWVVGDFNGDGKADTFRYLEGTGVDMFLSNGTSFDHVGAWSPAGTGSDNRWYVGDFNGDGKTDIFRYLDGSGVDVFLSNGSQFVRDHTWSPAGIGNDDYGHASPWNVGDFNGDGKADIFRFLQGASGADMFLSNGSSFVHVGSWTPAGNGTDNQWHIGDFNGDGTSDLLRQISGHGADVLI